MTAPTAGCHEGRQSPPLDGERGGLAPPHTEHGLAAGECRGCGELLGFLGVLGTKIFVFLFGGPFLVIFQQFLAFLVDFW